MNVDTHFLSVLGIVVGLVSLGFMAGLLLGVILYRR